MRCLEGVDNAESQGGADFSVWRLDDNNNEFLVREGMTGEEAMRLVREYEEKGHKQAYWVKQGGRARESG